MKQRHSLTKPALIAAAILAAVALNTYAQTVEEILDLGPGTSASDVCVNPFPNGPWPAGLFVAAYTPALGFEVLSADLTQSPPAITGAVDSFILRNRRLVAVAGALFEVGETLPGGNTAWHVRRSLDHGDTWQSLGPDWQLASGKSASAKGVTLDAAGRIFVCGRAADQKGSFHSIIRRSVDSGASWTIALDASKGNNAADIQFVPDVGPKQGGIFAVGRIGNYWTVWRSRDGGVTWPVVQSWVPSKWIAEATAIASDADGNIYVGGMGQTGRNATRNWYVWVSSNGGNTWLDLGNTFPSAADNIVNDLVVSEDGGELWVVGSRQSFSGSVSTISWAMQQWSLTGGWSAPDYFGYSGTVSRALGVAADTTTGRFYVAGNLTDAAGQSHATVMEITN